MGVNLKEIVPRTDIGFEKLKNKVIAVDAYNVLFQFITSIRQHDGSPLTDDKGRITSHLVGLFSRIPNLMSKGIKVCFVFDGESPEEKKQEVERRAKIKAEAKEKYFSAKDSGDVDGMNKYARQYARLSSEMVDEAKKLLLALGIPVIQAPSEAEAQAAYMCKKKDVWAVATQDYDALLFKSPRVIQNLTLSKKRKTSAGKYKAVNPQLIVLSDVLNELKIDHDQFIILSILTGTDFNVGGVKGIGPKTALKLVKSDKVFDKIFEEVDAKFDWKPIFNLIKNMPITDDYNLEFKEVNKETIYKLLVEEHNFSNERVENTLKKLFVENKQKDLTRWF